MSDVFANGNAIACKAGGGKVIAAFPDVCLSPPSPPAGPIPVPYPDTSFSKDMKNGSKKVKIAKKEVMLKDKSFYKSSLLGNEAATRSFGANVVTHVITGKTYFGAWSMDVKFEGHNVPRHIDFTTSNHGSYPGGSGPMTNAENFALSRIAQNKCPCCGKDAHATGVPMNIDEWYEAHNPPTRRNPNKPDEVKDLLRRARERQGCMCKKKNKKPLLPSPPCDVFFETPPPGPDRTAQRDAIHDAWDNKTPKYQKKNGIPTGASLTAFATQRFQNREGRAPNADELAAEEQKQTQTNHLTPKVAGGCPDKEGNLQPNYSLCDTCQALDEEFNFFQQGNR